MDPALRRFGRAAAGFGRQDARRQLPGRVLEMRFLLVALVSLFLFTSTAHAINCGTWTRLSPEQKTQTIDQMIQDAMRSNKARTYNVNTVRMSRCMERYSNAIELDFDGACARGGRTGMQALNNLFRNYIWSCAQ
jgi:hypothetical protein